MELYDIFTQWKLAINDILLFPCHNFFLKLAQHKCSLFEYLGLVFVYQLALMQLAKQQFFTNWSSVKLWQPYQQLVRDHSSFGFFFITLQCANVHEWILHCLLQILGLVMFNIFHADWILRVRWFSVVYYCSHHLNHKIFYWKFFIISQKQDGL